LDVSGIRSALRRDPSAASTKYVFDAAGGEKLYPVFMAISLGAPVDVIRTMYSLCPKAMGETTSGGWTPIHLAARGQANPAVLDFLMHKCPSQVGRKNKGAWYTPLHVACMAGAPVEIVRRLATRHPMSLSEKDSRGCVPLHYACRFGASLEVVRILVALRRRSLEERNAGGWTPLHAACAGGASPDVIELLVTKGAEACGVADALRWTPLHHACSKGAPVETIRLLIENHMDAVQMKNKEDRTAEDVAVDLSEESLAVLQASANIAELGPRSYDDAVRLLSQTKAMNWRFGTNKVIDSCPSVVHRLHISNEAVPCLLGKVAHDHQLQAMFAVISGIPDLIA